MQCEHETCVCEATQGQFCSDYCRDNMGNVDAPCSCGHVECETHHEKKQTSPGANDPVVG